MQRSSALVLTAFLAACASRPRPVSAPEPLRPDAARAPQPERSSADRQPATGRRADGTATIAQKPVIPPLDSLSLDSIIDLEIAAELEAAADSVADEEALEELANVHPAGGDDAADAVVTWDIDVASFTSHARVQYYLDFFTGAGRERMSIWLARLPRYEEMIRARLQESGLPGDLVYLALIESGFSNRAVSRARAVGMWQFMPATGRGYGLRIDGWVDERRDPVKATAAAARHLKNLRARFNSLYLAAAAYNAGAGRVGRSLNALGDGEPDEEEVDSLHSDGTFFRLYETKLLHRETKDYVPKLIAAAIIAKEPSRYGFTVTRPDAPFRADSVTVPDMTGLDVIARLSDTTVAELRELNPQYLRLVTPPRVRSIVLVPPGHGPSTQAALDSLPPGERVTFREHLVTRRQTASGVARQYGVTLSALYEVNPRIRGRRLRTGERLVIPVGGPMSTVVARSVAEPEAGVVSFHRVRRGETISGIARRYHVSQAQLKQWNRLGKSGMIRAGQRLRVGSSPTERARVATKAGRSRNSAAMSGGRVHTVRKGETLTALAVRYGVSVSALSSANGLSTKAKVRIGQRLRIPS